MELTKIAFGGGCHWCTEAVFQALIGVNKVEQGWISSTEKNSTFSEAVVVYYNAKIITLKTLTEIHLLTHKSTSNHSMRNKYRSAIYYFNQQQKEESLQILKELQTNFNDKIITKILFFNSFKLNTAEFQNYYQSNPEKPFCKNYINPKLKLLLQLFSKNVDNRKITHLNSTI
ncbi:peptide-methionine (S)-S-oxide reductase [Polaribacter sp. Asnod1-A03]|uniref:peptide-methionine (S)-S-oxide reductase n=1 Tax=Polaribacter sp. Asnod1-A03 TaxID=3160581 RepID=UPI003866BDBB